MIIMGISGVVLIGWFTELDVLTRGHPSLPSMKVNTAVCFGVLGFGQWSARREPVECPWTARLCAAIVLAIAAATLSQYVTGHDLGIDTMVHGGLRSLLGAGDQSPLRMSPVTAACLILLAIALVVLDVEVRRVSPAQVIAVVVTIVAVVELLGHFYGTRGIRDVRGFASMALPSAIALVVAATNVLRLRPRRGVMRLLALDEPTSKLARRMTVAVVLVPIGLGWLVLSAKGAGWYRTEFGVTLFAVGTIVCLGGMLWWTCASLVRSARALSDSEARFARLAASPLMGIGIVVDGTIVHANDKFLEIVGCPPDDRAAAAFTRLPRLCEWDAADERARAELLAHGTAQPYEKELARVDGSRVPVLVGATMVDDRTCLAFAVDRTEHRRAELAAQLAQRRFEALFGSGVVGVVVGTNDGAIREANDAFLAMLGYTRAELAAGLDWEQLTAPDDRAGNRATIDRLRTAGSPAPWRKDYLHRDGRRIPAMVGVAALDADTNLALVVDLTAQRQAEEALARTEHQLHQAHKMDAIGRLAGGVAHDFNNLLSVIISYADMIAAELRPSDPMAGEVEEVRKAAARASELTRQLLLFSRQQVVAPKVIDLNDCLRGMDRMLRRVLGEDIELTTTTARGVGRVCADPSNLEQVILNLVVNARDAMPGGGRLSIATTDVELGAEDAGLHMGARAGRHVKLAITDTGCGMDDATQERIFEPFFTTKPTGEGTGLGLSIVFGIVQRSGGHVRVVSAPARGTTFEVYLPCVDGSTDAAVVGPAPRDLRGKETVLLVEDEEPVRRVATSILRRYGYRVLDAASAGEALLLCEAHDGAIDVLLTDVVMPHMSGPELARRLRDVRPTLRVICMSGYADDGLSRPGTIDRNMAFLQKPLSPEALARKVREVVDAA